MPVVLNCVITLVVYSSVKEIENKIKTIHSRSTAVELYNKLAPNLDISISPVGVTSTINSDSINSIGDMFSELIPLIQGSMNNHYSRYEEAGIKELFHKFEEIISIHRNTSEKDVSEIPMLIKFNYCVTNNGNIEQYVYRPKIDILDEQSVYREIDIFKGVNIGTLPPKQKLCSNFDIRFLDVLSVVDIDESLQALKVSYKAKIVSMPTKRSVIYL